MNAGLVPITVTSRISSTTPGSIDSHVFSGGIYPQVGQNTSGVSDLDRISYSFRSGIDSEVTWALSALTRLSSDSTFALEKIPFVGKELVRIFYAPYLAFNAGNIVSAHTISLSSDALLTLRNLAQDLHNQQWLSQLTTFKKTLIDVLRFFSRFFYTADPEPVSLRLRQFEDNFTENYLYLLDLLEPLTCYYIDNPKNDALFQTLLDISQNTRDKTILISALNSLSHLLIVKPKDNLEALPDHSGPENDTLVRSSNCIEAITEANLEKYVAMLLLDDAELNYAVLAFLKSYLTSKALHREFPDSICDSQGARISRLLEVETSQANLHTLLKQLPILALNGLSLRHADQMAQLPQPFLTRRSQFGGVPPVLPALPQDLYVQILRLPEPLRATTWLRCCYEPHSATLPAPTLLTGTQDAMPGEVTQISLWKAYEKQFKEVWEVQQSLPTTIPRPELKQLLPAVEFIKNVSHAFPNSEAMVVNLEAQPGDAPKRKFIIKGIQPRQFAVPIDVGNYDALKPVPAVLDSSEKEELHKLPIGHIDSDKYSHLLLAASASVLAPENQITRQLPGVTAVNLLAYEVLDHIIEQCFPLNKCSSLVGIFRLYNGNWLPRVIYANPSLIDSLLINGNWLQYMV